MPSAHLRVRLNLPPAASLARRASRAQVAAGETADAVQARILKSDVRRFARALRVMAVGGTRRAAVLSVLALGVLWGPVGSRTPLAAQESAYVVPVETGDGWRTAALSDVGMDAEPFVRLLGRIRATEHHLIHSILVVRDGALVFEAYFDGRDVDLFDDGLPADCVLCFDDKHFARDTLHFAASVTKSVTGLLVGIAIDRGYLAGTDMPAFSFFPDYAQLRTPAKDRITVRHMLSMTAGLAFDETTYPIADPRNDAHRLFLSDDPVGFVLSRDLVDGPGTTYRYSSGTTVLLGEILRRTTGQRVPNFAAEHLFTPLGIREYRWASGVGAPDVTLASGGLYLRPRDMAKIGQLMLQDGLWDGRRVVSSAWVHQSVAMAIRVLDGGGAYGYGYQWRLGRVGGLAAFYAAGWGGQYIVVIPELAIVFVQTGGGYAGERMPGYDTILEQYVLPAIRGP